MPTDPGLITDTMARWQTPQIDPLAQYAKLQALRSGIQAQQLQAQQLQEGTLALQQKQKAIADQDAIDKAFENSRTVDAAGNVVYDRNKVLANVPGSHVATLQKTFNDADEAKTKADKAKADLQAANNDLGASFLLGVHDTGYDPQAFNAAVSHAVGTGVIPAPEGAQLLQQAQQNPTPEGIKALVDPLLARSDKVQGILTARQTSKAAADRAAAAGTTADVGKQKEQAAMVDRALNMAAAATDQPTLDAARGAVIRAGASPEEFATVPTAFDPAAMAAFRQARLTPEQRTQADQAALNAKNIEADRKVTQAQAAGRLAVDQQNAGINAKKFAMEFGGDAVKGWAKQVADNPDTANQVPPALRTPVSQAFTAATGLPFPKPLSGPAVDQERAAHNALQAVAQIQEALKDPEIQQRRGAVLGRIGNVEQDIGATAGLSDSAATKAAQLRSNLRYLFTQELKANIGGRPPVELAKALEAVSPNIKESDPLMQGSLNGVKDAALRTLDSADQQRFGSGQMRSREARGLVPAAAPAGVKLRAPDGTVSTVPADQVDHYLKLGAQRVQ